MKFDSQNRCFQLLFAAVTLICTFGVCPVTSANSSYTKAETLALAKFRPMVNDILLEDYMHTDEYLISWLRTKNLDPAEAKRMLSQSMDWRRRNKMSTILEEDFSKFRKLTPVLAEGVDNDGRIVITYLFGFYDFRKIALAGDMDMFQRYIARIFDEIQRRLRAANETEVISIFELHGFNARQHLCLQCLTIYPYFVSIYEGQYPMMSYKTYLVNVPTIFERVLEVIRPLFSEHTRNSLSILGLNKDEWTKLVQQQIPKEQLLIQFGGTRKVKASQGI